MQAGLGSRARPNPEAGRGDRPTQNGRDISTGRRPRSLRPPRRLDGRDHGLRERHSLAGRAPTPPLQLSDRQRDARDRALRSTHSCRREAQLVAGGGPPGPDVLQMAVPPIVLTISGAICIVIILTWLCAFVFLLLRDRDALRSERFTLEKLLIQRGLMGDTVAGFRDLEPGDRFTDVSQVERHHQVDE